MNMQTFIVIQSYSDQTTHTHINKYTTIQIHKFTKTQQYTCTDTEINDYTDIQIHTHTNTRLYHSTHIQIQKQTQIQNQ